MKLISLNTWGGRAGEGFIDFFKKAFDIDIFILQEIYNNASEISAWNNNVKRELLKELKELLPDYNAYYAANIFNELGLAVFVKKNLVVEETKDVFVFRSNDSLIGKNGTTIGRNIQYLKINDGNKKFNLFNFHGLWNGKDKKDSEDRINQSKKIIKFIKNRNEEIIFGGDFNLLPDTESLKMIENELNLKNLILEHKINSTRTSFYKKPERYADYIFVSKGIKVNEFKVLQDEISDHSPLYLDFE